MPEEWLTYREIGARLGLNVEAARTRVRRAGWRTQPGNDGRTRVLVSDEVFVEPVSEGGHGPNERVNRTGDMTGLVALLTAAEARISRLEGQLGTERDRVNKARSEVPRLRAEVAELAARADRAEHASTAADAALSDERERARALQGERDAAKRDVLAVQARLAEAQTALNRAEAETNLLAKRVNELTEADTERRARGRWARLRAAWRGG